MHPLGKTSETVKYPSDPGSFSLRIDDTRLEAAADRPQMSIYGGFKPGYKGRFFKQLCDPQDFCRPGGRRWKPCRGNSSSILFDSWEAEGEKVFYHPMLQRYFDGNPFALISTLLTAWREGVIRGDPFSYRNEG